MIACADGNTLLEHLTWSKWSGPTATGSGTLSLNDCQPNCASGKFHDYPVRVTLGHPNSADLFTLAVVTFEQGVPAGLHNPYDAQLQG